MSRIRYRTDMTVPLPGGIQYFVIQSDQQLRVGYRCEIITDSFNSTYDFTLLQGKLTAQETMPEAGSVDESVLNPVLDANGKDISEKNLTGNTLFNGNQLYGDYLVIKIESATTTGTGNVSPETDIASSFNEV